MNPITEWRFYTRSKEAWDAMYEDCARAKKSIDVEQYVFTYDELSKKFIEILTVKRREGVRVRVLCDMVGGNKLYFSEGVKELKNCGVELLFFNPIKPWRLNGFTSWYNRDHRKFLIVDSEIGYTGGVGFNKIMADYRDTQVRVKGAIVSNMEYVFNRMWHNTLNNDFYPFHRDLFSTGSTSIATNSPRPGQRFIYWQLIEMIREAKKYVYITTPYFIPDRRLLRIIRLAAKRGIDVRLLLPAVSDVRIVFLASHIYFHRLLRTGTRIFQYSGGVLHAKSVAIDDTWGSVGSANIDNLSFIYNYEANIVTSENKFIRDIKEDFLKDLESSKEMTLASLKNRPFKNKIYEFLLRPAHKLL